MVMTVEYAPPGSESKVEYSNSNMRGSTKTLTNSFTEGTSWSVSASASREVFKIFGVGVDGSISLSYSNEVEQVYENSNAMSVNLTQSMSDSGPGPASSAVGLDHD
jgi:hypothetical protein